MNGWREGQGKRTDRGRVGGGKKIDESKRQEVEERAGGSRERERRGANDASHHLLER